MRRPGSAPGCGGESSAVGWTFRTDLADGAYGALGEEIAPRGYAYLLASGGRATLAVCLFAEFQRKGHYLEKALDLEASNRRRRTMKRHTLWIPNLGTAALTALVLLLPLAMPADATGGPEALQIPEQPPGSMMAGGHHAVAQDDSTAAPCPMMEHGGTMGMMGREHHEVQPAAQATRQRFEELVSRLGATSGEERVEVMVEIVESLVAERCPMMAGGMDAMDGTAGMHGAAGMHRSTGPESTTP